MKTTSPFSCDFAQFKEQAATFFRRLKTPPFPTPAQVEAGEKAIYLAYIYLEASETEKHAAGVLLDVIGKYSNQHLADHARAASE